MHAPLPPGRLVRLAVLAILAFAVLPSAAAQAAADDDCVGSSAIKVKQYKITHLNGSVEYFADMTGRVRSGDTVKVMFKLPDRCDDTRLSLASYRATSPTGLPLQNQVLYSSQTGVFSDGGNSLTIKVFGSPGDPGNLAQCTQQAYPPGGNGANVPGPYDPTCNGAPSLNGNGGGNATGRPCAGCVGNADAKNPPGQMPDGNDPNAGYECDRNKGIGRTNPAHTGCSFFQVDFVTGGVLTQLGPLGSPNTYSSQGRLIDASNSTASNL